LRQDSPQLRSAPHRHDRPGGRGAAQTSIARLEMAELPKRHFGRCFCGGGSFGSGAARAGSGGGGGSVTVAGRIWRYRRWPGAKAMVACGSVSQRSCLGVWRRRRRPRSGAAGRRGHSSVHPAAGRRHCRSTHERGRGGGAIWVARATLARRGWGQRLWTSFTTPPVRSTRQQGRRRRRSHNDPGAAARRHGAAEVEAARRGTAPIPALQQRRRNCAVVFEYFDRRRRVAIPITNDKGRRPRPSLHGRITSRTKTTSLSFKSRRPTSAGF
jgi:hypothetical protein